VLGERHLRHVLLSYKHYYNATRTHLSLNKDSPFPRGVEWAGNIVCRPILGGLHHQYDRIVIYGRHNSQRQRNPSGLGPLSPQQRRESGHSGTAALGQKRASQVLERTIGSLAATLKNAETVTIP